MAPVGPETCTLEPPNTAATSPATMAVIEARVGAQPGGDPERQGQRQRDDPDREPATTSLAPRRAVTPA